MIGTLNEGALHAQLKEWYREPGDVVEVEVGGYVIDLVRGDLLVEFQTGGFAPLRRKLAALADEHRVRLVVLTLLRKQPRQAHCRAQLPRLRAHTASHRD